MKGRILAHRGFWEAPAERNTAAALRRALAAGFGLETDIRDLDGELVLSHDPPRAAQAPWTVAALLACYRDLGSEAWLALNIKADGLAAPLAALLAAHGITRAFVFDMSVPDMRGWLGAGVPVFTRRSDIEPDPVLLPQSAGVWLDGFEIPFAPAAWADATLGAGRMAALVSPELHRRAPLPAWEAWRAALDLAGDPGLMLCTDLPEDAVRFFGETR